MSVVEYAVLKDNGELIFFQSSSTYTNNTTGTFEDISGNSYVGRLFANFSNRTFSSYSDVPWYSIRSSIRTINIANGSTITPIDCSYWFYNCSSCTSIDLSRLNTANVTSLAKMFYGCTSVTSLNVSGWNTSNVTTMDSTFAGMQKITSLNISHFNFSKVTNLYWFLRSCAALTTITFPSNFDTSKVTTMSYMFYGCSGLSTLTLPSSMSTALVTDMSYMFYGCTKLTTLVIPSNLNTSAATNMSYMFYGCTALVSLTLSNNFNTSNVTNMSYMFYNCNKIEILTLPDSFNTSSATNKSYMFTYCSKIRRIRLPANFSFKTSSGSNQAVLPTNSNYSWYREDGAYGPYTSTQLRDNYNGGIMAGTYEYFLPAPANIPGPPYAYAVIEVFDTNKFDPNYPYPLSYAGTIGNYSKLTFFQSNNVYLSKFNFESGDYTDIMGNTYHGYIMPGVEVLNASNYSDIPWATTDFRNWFGHEIEVIEVANGSTITPQSMAYFFANCYPIKVNLNGFDFSNVTIMRGLFYANGSGSFPISSFQFPSNIDTSNVTDMSYMFDNSGLLYQSTNTSWLNNFLRKLDTSNVTNMSHMFVFPTDYTGSLDLSNFDTSKVTDLSYFIREAPITSLDISNFNTLNVTNMNYFLGNCYNLEKLTISSNFAIPSSNNNNVLRNLTGTNRWVNGAYGPYTTTEFINNYDRTTMSGTWGQVDYDSTKLNTLYLPGELIEIPNSLKIFSYTPPSEFNLNYYWLKNSCVETDYCKTLIQNMTFGTHFSGTATDDRGFQLTALTSASDSAYGFMGCTFDFNAMETDIAYLGFRVKFKKSFVANVPVDIGSVTTDTNYLNRNLYYSTDRTYHSYGNFLAHARKLFISDSGVSNVANEVMTTYIFLKVQKSTRKLLKYYLGTSIPTDSNMVVPSSDITYTSTQKMSINFFGNFLMVFGPALGIRPQNLVIYDIQGYISPVTSDSANNPDSIVNVFLKENDGIKTQFTDEGHLKIENDYLERKFPAAAFKNHFESQDLIETTELNHSVISKYPPTNYVTNFNLSKSLSYDPLPTPDSNLDGIFVEYT